MEKYLLLNAEQAAHVRGPSATDPSSVLAPAVRQGGVYILPDTVLTAEAHEAHWEYLASLPQMDRNDPGFPPALESVVE